MHKILINLTAFALIALFTLPMFAGAQEFNLIVCDGVEEECTFNHLIELAHNLINALVIISTLLATVAFIYAGFKLLTSSGNPGAMADAKKIFMSVLKGYLWILVAWLLIYTITTALLNDGYDLLGEPQ